jgi:hypothetical protein
VATDTDEGRVAAAEDDAEREDRELVARAGAGEAAALEALLRRHQARLHPGRLHRPEETAVRPGAPAPDARGGARAL